MNLQVKKALTLIELIMAITLMGFVMLTATNIEIASRKFSVSADKEAQLQLRLSTAMEHMVKNISLMHSDVSHVGFINLGNSFTFQRDQEILGSYTPQDYTDDVWMRYSQNSGLWFCANGGGAFCNVAEQMICAEVTALQFIVHNNPQFCIEIVLTGQSAGVNPVTLHTFVSPRSASNN